MIKYVVRKLLISVLTSLVLSLLLAYLNYTPNSQRSSDTAYWSFSSLLLVYVIYSLPVTMIAGVPISILIDKWITFKMNVLSFIIRTMVYGIAGALVFCSFLLLIDVRDFTSSYLDVFKVLLIGVVGAVLFYWLELILKYVIQYQEKS